MTHTEQEAADAYALFCLSYPDSKMSWEEFTKFTGTMEVWILWLRDLRVKPTKFFTK